MAEIRTRNTPDWVVEQLDEIVRKENYESRPQLINYILELYVTSHSKFLTAALPPIVEELCANSIREKDIEVENMMKNISITYNHIAKTVDEIRAVLSSEKQIRE